MAPLYRHMLNMRPQGGAMFIPKGIILTNLAEVYYNMLHTKYQSSTPCGFRQEYFLKFSLVHVALISNGLEPFEHILKVIQESFLAGLVKIQSVV